MGFVTDSDGFNGGKWKNIFCKNINMFCKNINMFCKNILLEKWESNPKCEQADKRWELKLCIL